MGPIAGGDIGWKQKTQSKQSILMFQMFTPATQGVPYRTPAKPEVLVALCLVPHPEPFYTIITTLL